MYNYVTHFMICNETFSQESFEGVSDIRAAKTYRDFRFLL